MPAVTVPMLPLGCVVTQFRHSAAVGARDWGQVARTVSTPERRETAIPFLGPRPFSSHPVPQVAEQAHLPAGMR